MATITWSERMSVGVPEVDADHKTLVGLINHLHRSIGDPEEYATLGSVLKSLEDYAADHFAREERMMAAARYPGLAVHIQAHFRLAQEVSKLNELYHADRTSVRAKDCLDFLHKWLVEHICTTDMDYRGWVVGHEGAASVAGAVTMTGPARGQGAASIDWRGLGILVVDDNANFCEIMRTVLQGVGVEDIDLAVDLAGARAALERRPYHVAVSDWHVGAESGLDLVAWIRAHPRLARLPVLLLSGHERVANRDVAVAAGADEFMEKPISARGLLICLARLLARRDKECEA
jgi:hemerythrin-like metal-binding protein